MDCVMPLCIIVGSLPYGIKHLEEPAVMICCYRNELKFNWMDGLHNVALSTAFRLYITIDSLTYHFFRKDSSGEL